MAGADFAVRHAQRGQRARQHVLKQRGIRALLGQAADFFVIEDGADVDVRLSRRGDERRREV